MGQLRPHGPIWTPFDVAYKHAKEVSKFWRQDAVELTEHPEEVAPAFIFLASEQCSKVQPYALLHRFD